ncbi:MAG: TldD/PmbA family protein [Candidatus Eremiobacterota bacterium]
MKSLIEETISKVKADYLEIRIEHTKQSSINFEGKTLKSSQQVEDGGGYVRALIGGGWGFKSFNDTSGLLDHALSAVKSAKILKKPAFRMSPVSAYREDIKPSTDGKKDPRTIPFKDKVEYFRNITAGLMEASERIINVRSAYGEREKHIIIANSEGTYLNIEDLDISGGLSVIARKDNVIQSAHQSYGTKNNWEDITVIEEHKDRLVSDALALTEAEPVKGGHYTVILDPRIAGVFIHEAFGHLSEGDAVCANPTLQEQMTFGRVFGGKHLNVCDGAAVPGLRGSFGFDDEGTPSALTHMIREGKLQGRLHSRETAGKMREAVTGNARTVSYRFPPICRMTNTFIDKGEATFEDMLLGIEHGIYACGSGSGNTSMDMFTFSAEKGFIIRNGKIENMLRDVVLTGNVFETLANIDMIGSDLTFSRGGSCGRSYGQRLQYPLPVSMGSPHIRILNVLVGGR